MLSREQRDRLRAATIVAARLRKAGKKPPMHKPSKPDRGRVRDNTYLAWIRRLPCLAGTVEGGCQGTVESAHVRFADAAAGWDAPGLQRKPSDLRALPLCSLHHQHDQHRGNERAFYERLGVNAPALCAALRAAFEADRDGAAVIRQHTRRAA